MTILVEYMNMHRVGACIHGRARLIRNRSWMTGRGGVNPVAVQGSLQKDSVLHLDCPLIQ